MLKISEIRDLSREELEEKIKDLKKSLFEMRMQRATGRVEKHSRFKHARRDIARILTVMKDKEKK